MTNFCSNCGSSVQQDWKYCPFCNFPLQKVPFSDSDRIAEPVTPYVATYEEDTAAFPAFPSVSEVKPRRGLSKGQKKAILIIIIIALSGVITGVSLYFGLNKVRTINYYVNNGLTSRSYTYALPRAEFDSVSSSFHPTHSYYDPDLVVQAIETYCTPECTELAKIGLDIISECFDKDNDEEIINALLSFTQGITYKSESQDLAQYPLETIFNSGDCEDLSILFGSLVETVGYSAVLLCVELWDYDTYEWIGHVMVGVYLPFTPLAHPSSWYCDLGGYEYWLCETTSQGWLIGELPVLNSDDIVLLAYNFVD